MSLVTREMAAAAQNGASQLVPNGDPGIHDQRLQVAAVNADLTSSNDLSRDYNPPPSSFSSPSPKHNQNGNADRRTDGLADFFSSDVFQIVLHNPTTAHRLLKFSQARMCGENMEFLEKVHTIRVAMQDHMLIQTIDS